MQLYRIVDEDNDTHMLEYVYAAVDSGVLALVEHMLEGGTTMSDRMAVSDLLSNYRPGSGEWGWEYEFNEIDRRLFSNPILLGSDGRVWDGHHRIRLAVALGLETVLVERMEDDDYGELVNQDGKGLLWREDEAALGLEDDDES